MLITILVSLLVLFSIVLVVLVPVSFSNNIQVGNLNTLFQLSFAWCALVLLTGLITGA